MNRIVCLCGNVKEKEIVTAIKKTHTTKLKDVQLITGAACGCGRCIPAINILMEKGKTEPGTNVQKKLF